MTFVLILAMTVPMMSGGMAAYFWYGFRNKFSL
jgi:hypothetical protein